MEYDASSAGLDARLLQVREGMDCQHNEAPEDAAPCPIAFATKILTSEVTKVKLK